MRAGLEGGRRLSVFLGIIASLLFVGLEIKQSRDIALAEIYQHRASMLLDISLGIASSEQLEVTFSKIYAGGAELTQFDAMVLDSVMERNFIYFENVHFQYQLGMISEEEWTSTRKLVQFVFLRPCTVPWWERTKGLWRHSFVAEVDSLIPQMDLSPCKLTAVLQGE